MPKLTKATQIRRGPAISLPELSLADIVLHMRECCMAPTEEGHCQVCVVCEGANRLLDADEMITALRRATVETDTEMRRLIAVRDDLKADLDAMRGHAPLPAGPGNAELLARLEALERGAAPAVLEHTHPPRPSLPAGLPTSQEAGEAMAEQLAEKPPDQHLDPKPAGMGTQAKPIYGRGPQDA